MKKIVLIAAFAVLGIGSASAGEIVVTTSCGTKFTVNVDDDTDMEQLRVYILAKEAKDCPKTVEKDKDTSVVSKP